MTHRAPSRKRSRRIAIAWDDALANQPEARELDASLSNDGYTRGRVEARTRRSGFTYFFRWRRPPDAGVVEAITLQIRCGA